LSSDGGGQLAAVADPQGNYAFGPAPAGDASLAFALDVVLAPDSGWTDGDGGAATLHFADGMPALTSLDGGTGPMVDGEVFHVAPFELLPAQRIASGGDIDGLVTSSDGAWVVMLEPQPSNYSGTMSIEPTSGGSQPLVLSSTALLSDPIEGNVVRFTPDSAHLIFGADYTAIFGNGTYTLNVANAESAWTAAAIGTGVLNYETSSDSRYIAFNARDPASGGNYALYLANTDGSAPGSPIALNVLQHLYRFSDDGTHLAYIANQNDELPATGDLYVRTLGDGGSNYLASNVESFVVSPAGGYIAFDVQLPDAGTFTEVADTAGAQPPVVLVNAGYNQLNIAPNATLLADGSHLVVTDANATLYRSALPATGALTTLATNLDDGAALSPDQTQAGCRTGTGNTLTLVATDGSGNNVSLGTGPGGFAFSADNRWVAYGSSSGLLISSRDGSVTSAPLNSDASNYIFTPDSSELVFDGNASTTQDLFSVSTVPGSSPVLLASGVANGKWRLSPDGKEVAFLDATGQLQVARVGGGLVLPVLDHTMAFSWIGVDTLVGARG